MRIKMVRRVTFPDDTKIKSEVEAPKYPDIPFVELKSKTLPTVETKSILRKNTTVPLAGLASKHTGPGEYEWAKISDELLTSREVDHLDSYGVVNRFLQLQDEDALAPDKQINEKDAVAIIRRIRYILLMQNENRIPISSEREAQRVKNLERLEKAIITSTQLTRVAGKRHFDEVSIEKAEKSAGKKVDTQIKQSFIKLKEQYQNQVGVKLKIEVLYDFKDKIKDMDRDTFDSFKKEYKSSAEYKILAYHQDFWGNVGKILFGKHTASVNSLEKAIKAKERELLDQENSNRLVK